VENKYPLARESTVSLLMDYLLYRIRLGSISAVDCDAINKAILKLKVLNGMWNIWYAPRDLADLSPAM
jgi:hypothetical protein